MFNASSDFRLDRSDIIRVGGLEPDDEAGGNSEDGEGDAGKGGLGPVPVGDGSPIGKGDKKDGKHVLNDGSEQKPKRRRRSSDGTDGSKVGKKLPPNPLGDGDGGVDDDGLDDEVDDLDANLFGDPGQE